MSLLVKICKTCGSSERYENSGRCKICQREYLKKRYRENPERAKIYYQRSREKYLEERKLYLKIRYSLNKEYYKDKIKKWKKNNKDKLIVYEQNRRAAKNNYSGKLSKDIREKLFQIQNGLCNCCGLNLGNDFHLDHIIPLSKGGLNIDENVQLLRKTCNLAKSSKEFDEYIKQKAVHKHMIVTTNCDKEKSI